MSYTCGECALDVRTYYAGNNQVTHPSVISFSETWNGYKYYMAYTPYPYGNGSEENPCLAVSNDLINWVKPEGLINPIAWCEETECDELKDPHLLYRKDLDQIEMWYLGRIASSIEEKGPLYCFRKISKDGRHWSEYEVVFCFGTEVRVSPSVYWNGLLYDFWCISNKGKTGGELYHMQSVDAQIWSELQKCDVPSSLETQMWHGSVSKYHDQYYLVWVGNGKKSKNKIYFAESQDGIHYQESRAIIQNDTKWAFLYRPTLLVENDRYFCIYGVVRCDGKWLVSMSSGDDLDHLSGLSTGSLPQEACSRLISSTSKMQIRCVIKHTQSLFVPRLLAIVPALLLCRLLTDITPLTVWLISILASAVASPLLIKCFSLKFSVFMGTVSACITAFLYELIIPFRFFFM